MNKQDLVDAVAKRLGVTGPAPPRSPSSSSREDGMIAVRAGRGGKVAISGFGNFEIRRRAAREGRNPRTGKAIPIKASTVPAFRAGGP